MKKAIFILFLFSAFTALAQEKAPANRKFNIKTNPFGSLVNMIPISIEYMFSEKFSFSANAFIVRSNNGSGPTLFEQKGYSIGPEIRYYFSEVETIKQVNKVYLGGQFGYEEYSNLTLDRYDDPINGWAHGLSGALVVGSQWFLNNRFTIDLFLGPAYAEYVNNKHFDDNISKGGFFISMTGSKVSGTRVRLGFNIGITI